MKLLSLLRKPLIKLCLVSICTIVSAHTLAQTLLNGVATHEELGQEQFIAGLYTNALTESAISILSAQEEKRLQVRVIADQLSTRRFKRMWIEGMAINSSPAELEKHANDMAAFSNMLKIRMIKGDIFEVTRTLNEVAISVNGINLGNIDDPQFFDLLLRTWIGPVPLSSDFRSDLLSAGNIKAGPLGRFESIRPSDERIAKIKNAIANKAATIPESTPKSVEVAIDATNIKPDIEAPKIGLPADGATSAAAVTGTAVDAATKLSISAPKIGDGTDQASEESKSKTKSSPAPNTVALAPKPPKLDESIFDEDEGEFTAESLLKEQLYYSQAAKYTYKYLKYPNRAYQRGHEGNIRLRVTIDRKGKVIEKEIMEESKYKSLNKAALSAVDSASPYPAMPDEIKGNDFTFTFRVVFKLK